MKAIFSALILVALTVPAVRAANNFTIWVAPPNGTDDTAVLQAALDECMTNHPTGCTMQLAAGTYKSTQLLAENFHGAVQGAGTDATSIEVLAPLVVTVFDQNVFAVPPSRINKYPMLLIFVTGDITVSNMSFKVSDFSPATPWCYGEGNCGQTWLKGLVGVYGSSANLVVNRVGFQGGPGTLDGRNYDNGTFFLGAPILTGNFKVTSSRFSYAENGLEVFGVRDAQVVIGGSPTAGNKVEDGLMGGIFVDFENSKFDYSYNEVEIAGMPYAGVFVLQGVSFIPQKPSRFLIRHNDIRAIGGYEDGVVMVDRGLKLGFGKTADFVVTNNKIQLGGSEVDPAYAGIESIYAVDAIISNNVISGEWALMGIAAESSTQCMLKANNVQQLRPLFVPVALLGLNSGFPWDTSNCTVLGGENKVDVYDEGTNNTLVGVNNMKGNPPGPAVKQAMQHKREILATRLP